MFDGTTEGRVLRHHPNFGNAVDVCSAKARCADGRLLRNEGGNQSGPEGLCSLVTAPSFAVAFARPGLVSCLPVSLSMHTRLSLIALSLVFVFAFAFRAQNVLAQAPAPQPTLANVPYGKHPRQVLDFYQAKTPTTSPAPAQPTPLLFFIHGGGWMTGDKANPDFLAKCLENGISVVSINYRFIPDATAEKIDPPVKACLDDAARALQFVRSKAVEWNIDKDRIGGCGGSAGGFTALWLAFHPDGKKVISNQSPDSTVSEDDPISRESTRLSCVLAFVPQTTLDPQQMMAWIPNNEYGNHAFGLGSMQEFLEKRESLLPWIKEFSPYALASADDPPVLLFYDNPPNLGHPYKDPPHSANWGAGLAEKLQAVGIEHEINYNNDFAHMKYPDLFSFIVAKLKPSPPK